MLFLRNLNRFGLLATLVLLALFSTSLFLSASVVSAAAPTSASDCKGESVFDNSVHPAVCRTPISAKGLPQPKANTAELKIILGIVFGIVGALSLLIITVSGFRYVLSAGDPQTMSKAKNGIVYALVGLVIALAAEAIVAFVVDKL